MEFFGVAFALKSTYIGLAILLALEHNSPNRELSYNVLY